MIIQAELRRKQSEYEGEAYNVDKVIELPAQRFKQFSRALLADYDFIAENKNAVQHDEAARHCLLILDAEGTDGFLVDPQGYNYARYSAFVPNARSLLTPDMGIDRSYLSPAEPWRNENRDEMLRMTLRVDGKPDYTLVLPADEEYLDAVKDYLDIDVFADAMLCDIRFKVPYIGELIRDTDCPAVEDYNDFAEALEDIWQKDGMLLTYAAVLEAEKPETLCRACELLRNLDNYQRIVEGAYGFLTKYIFADGIEEIDINSWRDIEIQYSDGHTAKLEEHFDSPEHAANVIRRMLQNSGKVLDNASPIITSRLAKNIRISVIKTPVLDEDAGVAASIRIVNPRNLSKADFVQSGTATEEMLDFLSACLRYGVSICVAGATSSGKTTVAGWLLSTIPDRKRIFTIEDGSRELQLIRERDGRVTNSVVHTQTRDSENERQRIDQIALLDIALRFNPDIICVGEMRGPEANAAQEAARVGIAVLTTIHSNSSEGTYRRMVSLCKRAVDTPDDTLMGYVTEAYPIVVYCRQLENKQRRITNISECEILPDGSRRLHKLYEYHITDNHLEDDHFIIEGEHRKCEEISESLRRRFIENGMPLGELAQFVQGKEEDE